MILLVLLFAQLTKDFAAISLLQFSVQSTWLEIIFSEKFDFRY